MFTTPDKIADLTTLTRRSYSWRVYEDDLVFTHGAFDALHPVHIALLEEARALGQRLIVGVYGDDVVSGTSLSAEDRAKVVAALMVVDAVVILESQSPDEVIEAIKPDVVVVSPEADAAHVSPDLIMKHDLRHVELANPEADSLSSWLEKARS